MTDKEQIEEMVKIIDNGTNTTCFSRDKEHTKCGDCEECWTYSIAKILYNAGYHKTIWHKVADGDLPKPIQNIWFIDKRTNLGFSGYYNAMKKVFISDFDHNYRIKKDEVIAWTELPKYKEKEI